jgi:O-antigen/teichoic acid export membrane protein
VLFPALATIQDDVERLRAVWLRGKRLAVALLAPVFVVVAVLAPDLVPVVFGDNWEDAIPVLQLLCVAGIAYSLGTLDWSLLVVRAKTHTLFRISLLVTSAVIIAVLVGTEWGIEGVASGYAVALWVLALPTMWVTTRAGSVGFRQTLRAAASPLPFALASGAVGYAMRRGLVDAGVPAGVRLAVTAGAIVLVYSGLAWLGSEPLRDEARRAIGRIRRRPAAVASDTDRA